MVTTEPTINATALEVRLQKLQAANVRLRNVLAVSEQKLHEAEKHRDKYHEFAKLWIDQNCKLADWDDFNPEDYTVPIEELVAQAEGLLKSGG